MISALRTVALAVAALYPLTSPAQQPSKPPISVYGMDVATTTMSIPGMPAGGMGAIAGMAGMGMAGMGGPQKQLWLGLRSSHKAAGTPESQHEIPPGMNMGAALPLVGYVPAQGARETTGEDDKPLEKPKARLLLYWGCGDAIRPGQPKIADTEKMSLVDFGKTMAGRAPPERGGAWRNAQLLWPNDREKRQVPPEASLRGNQLVKGNATPDIRFALGDRQDFMAPFEVAAQGAPAGPTSLSWAAIPTAQGYFLQAMGARQSGNEMIIWTSSELQDTGWGLMTFLPNDFLRRMIGEKVVLPATATNCTIPKEVFDGVEGAMVNGIAYGEELNLAHPPRPADAKAPWEPVWAVKVRVKSTGMTPLGMGDMDDSRASRRGGDRSTSGGQGGMGMPANAPAAEPKAASPANDAAEAVKSLRKLLPF
jgi:hypothetical protein